MTTLSTVLQRYFTDFAHNQRDLSGNTVAAYRDTWRLLIKYAADALSLTADRIGFEHLTADQVNGFLDYLQNERGNTATTRNARLSAIRAVLTFALPDLPEHAGTITRVLAIPPKRVSRRTIEFLDHNEQQALIAAPNQVTWTGRRDHAFLVLAIQTGLRISELTTLTIADIHLGTGAHVTCTGKGRKRRVTPLTPTTLSVMTTYIDERRQCPGQALFCGPHGRPLSRDALEHRLALHNQTASTQQLSLAEKRITVHTLRHTAAMNLLAANIDVSVIALYLGHANIHSTDAYLHANMEIKQAAINRTRPPTVETGDYQPDPDVLTWLQTL